MYFLFDIATNSNYTNYLTHSRITWAGFRLIVAIGKIQSGVSNDEISDQQHSHVPYAKVTVTL